MLDVIVIFNKCDKIPAFLYFAKHISPIMLFIYQKYTNSWGWSCRSPLSGSSMSIICGHKCLPWRNYHHQQKLLCIVSLNARPNKSASWLFILCHFFWSNFASLLFKLLFTSLWFGTWEFIELTLHNAHIVQYLFTRTKEAWTYLRFVVLSYDLIYIYPGLFSYKENKKNRIFVSNSNIVISSKKAYKKFFFLHVLKNVGIAWFAVKNELHHTL